MKLLRGILAAAFVMLVVLSACADAAQKPLAEPEVRAAVERLLGEKQAATGWEISIRQLSVPRGIATSVGTREIEIMAPGGWSGWEPVSLALVVRVNGRVEKNLSLRLLVDARADMVVAARQLAANTVLTADDLQVVKHEVAQAGGQPLARISEAVGKKLRAAVRSGVPIRAGQLASVPVVVSGQLVTIIAENGGVRITVAGRARSSGGIGDLIRVQNLLSHKEFPARVLDASTVEVGF